MVNSNLQGGLSLRIGCEGGHYRCLFLFCLRAGALVVRLHNLKLFPAGQGNVQHGAELA